MLMLSYGRRHRTYGDLGLVAEVLKVDYTTEAGVLRGLSMHTHHYVYHHSS